MQHIFSNADHTKSELLFLPIVDLNPSNPTCIYSTLTYIQSQAKQLNIPVPCVTFDQPLWIKAVEIIKSQSLKIVCRLGGFHTMMSFLGSIGSVISTRNSLWFQYSHPYVVWQRALRGHFLVEAALVNKLITVLLPPELVNCEVNVILCEDQYEEDSNEQEKLDCNEVNKICEFYQSVKDRSMLVSEIAELEEFVKLEECLMKYKALLAKKSPTAKLWLQYIEYIETLNYAKSARLYL